MSEGTPWLTIVGLGEDGPDGLTGASHAALDAAEIVMGPPRHLALLPDLTAERVAWPVPFADGLDRLEGYAGRQVVVLASGDPFWFGAGSVIARRFSRDAWRALPGVSCFALAVAHLGWPLEKTLCLGQHAAPLTRLRPHLAHDARLIVTLRDGAAVTDLGDYLTRQGFGDSTLHILQGLGGPREEIRRMSADAVKGQFTHPICAAIEVSGAGAVLPRASGFDDRFFDSDGVMTKRPVRALTLSALAPRPGEHLWDIGGGSGSIGIEWLLSHPTTKATTIETRTDRIALIRANAASLGVDRLQVVEGRAPKALGALPQPDVVFIGGGLSEELLKWLFDQLNAGTRLVANAVTLESEALLLRWQDDRGGTLLRIDLSEAAPLGPRRGWKAAFPVVQWSVTL